MAKKGPSVSAPVSPEGAGCHLVSHMIISMLKWSVPRSFCQCVNLIDGRGGRADMNVWNTGAVEPNFRIGWDR
jgi:hypothetical protein